MPEPIGRFEHGYTCQEVVELATEFVDGAMPAGQATRFEMHLNFCDGCAIFIDQIRATAAAAARLTEDQIPEGTRSSLLAAFRDWRGR